MEEATGKTASDFSELRIAISCGIFGSIGATMGWILWLAYMSASADLLVTIVVGAGIGLLVSWTQHYISTAKRERNGPPSEDESEDIKRASPDSGRSTLLWATGFAFLGIASEQVVSELVSEYLRPFLASLVTLLPAGIVFGIIFNEGRTDENRFVAALHGAFAGFIVALLTCGLRYLMGGPIPWGAMIGWWVLIGVGQGACMPMRGKSRGYQPLLGVLTALSIAYILTFPAVADNFVKLPGPLGAGAKFFVMAVDESLAAPDLPAQFWIEAEARREGRKVSGVPVSQEQVREPVDRYLNQIKSKEDYYRSDTEFRSDRFRSEFEKGMGSALVRSWVVLALFSVGIGAAPSIEAKLRPADYPNSRTAFNDKRILVGIIFVILASCLYLRMNLPG